MTKKENMVVVIMAGGSGTRFWPLSTKENPKQFIRLFGNRTMIQHTCDRVLDIVDPENILVVTSKMFLETVREQLPQIPEENILCEPMPRDTSGAVALAAYYCRLKYNGSIMVTLAADHYITPKDKFLATLVSAATEAEKSGSLYTIGIKPTYPATGYGYLQTGDEIPTSDAQKHFKLKCFVEKPDEKRACSFLESGDYFWNSGMFVWKTESIISEIEKYLPDHAKLFDSITSGQGMDQFKEGVEEIFPQLPKISIDFGVMEKAEDVRMVMGDFGWSDVGSWPSLEQFYEPDENCLRSKGTLITHDARNCFSFCEDESEVVAMVGVENVIVVRNGKTTLVVDRSQSENIKKLVEKYVK